MRVLSLLGLVLALAVVGMLVKRQLDAARVSADVPTLAAPSQPPPANAHEQSQQVQQQYKQALDAALQQQQQQRNMLDDVN
ncbi:MAG: hypothetical protein Q4G71_16520 [Pseudomonadota bacterium]|nr:hypothetical protein [Pseudomonadota bacterium]